MNRPAMALAIPVTKNSCLSEVTLKLNWLHRSVQQHLVVTSSTWTMTAQFPEFKYAFKEGSSPKEETTAKLRFP